MQIGFGEKTGPFLDLGRRHRSIPSTVDALIWITHPNTSSSLKCSCYFRLQRLEYSKLTGQPCQAAKSRNAKIFSRIVGWGRAFDPSSSRVNWGKGVTALESGLSRCFHQFEMDFSEIDLIISGASGSISGDRLEAWVLKKAWTGQNLPPILTPKGITGEYGGTFLAAAVLAASGNSRISFPAFEILDPELNIFPHDGSRLENIKKTLITSLGSSGTGSWLILEQP